MHDGPRLFQETPCEVRAVHKHTQLGVPRAGSALSTLSGALAALVLTARSGNISYQYVVRCACRLRPHSNQSAYCTRCLSDCSLRPHSTDAAQHAHNMHTTCTRCLRGATLQNCLASKPAWFHEFLVHMCASTDLKQTQAGVQHGVCNTHVWNRHILPSQTICTASLFTPVQTLT